MEINEAANVKLKHKVHFCNDWYHFSDTHMLSLYIAASISGHQECAPLVCTDAEIPDCYDTQHFLNSFCVHSYLILPYFMPSPWRQYYPK